MFEDMDDIEKLRWMELRYGITKTIKDYPTVDKIKSIESELFGILSRYKDELKIASQLPRVHTWMSNYTLNFMFFDRSNGKRILLANWFSDKEGSQ